MQKLRLSTRLGITHGLLVALLLVLLGGTQQGLLRMLGLIVDISDNRLSTVDMEEDIHRRAWAIETRFRHAPALCANAGDEAVRTDLKKDRDALADAARREEQRTPPPLRSAAQRYIDLADDALSKPTCEFVVSEAATTRRLLLDEELTNAWIDRLQDLHGDIEAKEDQARRIGVGTAVVSVAVAILAAVAAVVIARNTARSVAEPISRLAREATRLGMGDFSPIPEERGSPEIEELWRDLDRMRVRLLEIEQLKTVFFASVSHELRSPLGRLREALALLGDGTCGPLTPKQERVARLAARACEQEVRIVDALLDMSRLRSGQPLHRQGNHRIDDVLRSAVAAERGDAADRGVDVVLELEAGTTAPMEMDAPLVERAVANLVRNAVSVSKRGDRVVVRRSIRKDDDGTDRVAILVEDTGPGLPEAARQSLFSPFAAAGVASAGRSAGIGLGLSLAREVARAHEGDLSLVRSTPEGTAFVMELPARRDA